MKTPPALLSDLPATGAAPMVPAARPSRLAADARSLVPDTPARPSPGRQVLVVAFPFASFSRVNAFIAAVQGVPGVIAVTPRRLHGGALYLMVNSTEAGRLPARLADLAAFRPRVTADGDDLISVVIEPV